MKTLKVKVSKSLHLTIIWLFFTLLTVSITTAQSADAQKANVVSDVHPDFVTDVTTGGTDPIHITNLVND